jgi:hypothetical protein
LGFAARRGFFWVTPTELMTLELREIGKSAKPFEPQSGAAALLHAFPANAPADKQEG